MKKKIQEPVLKIVISNGSEISFTSEKKCLDFIKSLRESHFRSEGIYWRELASWNYRKMLKAENIPNAEPGPEPIRPPKLVVTFIPIKPCS